MQVEFRTTVKNGFPVKVKAEVVYDEIFRQYEVEDMEILTAKGRPATFLALSQDDMDDLEVEVLEARDEEARREREEYEYDRWASRHYDL